MREEGAMIRLHQLEKAVRSGAGQLFLLRNVNLTVARGDFVTLMGPSGAGKSTLLAVLGFLDAEWTGEFDFDGQRVDRLSAKDRQALARKHVGFVFQKYHLLDDLTVSENLEVPLSYRGVSRKEIQSKVADTLDRFHIVGKKDLYPAQLSGGQQQLVGVARAVIGDPSLILADEPTGNLHSEQAREIMQLFRRLNDEGTTIIQVTHSAENAAFGKRTLRMADGWLRGEEVVR
jgi:putative ABC transport system ATP-binding protein